MRWPQPHTPFPLRTASALFSPPFAQRLCVQTASAHWLAGLCVQTASAHWLADAVLCSEYSTVYWNERDENDAVSRYNRTARLTHDPLEIRFGDQVQLNGPNDSCISSNKQTGASHRQTRAMGRDRLCLPSAM